MIVYLGKTKKVLYNTEIIYYNILKINKGD